MAVQLVQHKYFFLDLYVKSCQLLLTQHHTVTKAPSLLPCQLRAFVHCFDSRGKSSVMTVQSSCLVQNLQLSMLNSYQAPGTSLVTTVKLLLRFAVGCRAPAAASNRQLASATIQLPQYDSA